MRHFGGWFRPVVTMLASLAMIVSTAVTAFAAAAPPFVPASPGQRSQVAQSSGDWGQALAVILVVSLTSALVLGWIRVRHHSLREGKASSITEATP
jgi:hypothetical protein